MTTLDILRSPIPQEGRRLKQSEREALKAAGWKTLTTSRVVLAIDGDYWVGKIQYPWENGYNIVFGLTVRMVR